MHEFDFDTVRERRRTDSLKYDYAKIKKKPTDALPLWVADMDFPVAPAIHDALISRVDHGIFGYSDDADGSYYNMLSAWYVSHFGYETKPQWLVKTPGVVYAICTAIRAYTCKDDAVLIQEPVYYPFRQSVTDNERRLVVNPLQYIDGRYEIDLAHFERCITENNVSLFILCSPHNPVGRVWRREELTAMGDICLKHNVLVVADEIHADFVYEGHQHHVFAGLKPAYADITITCTAPTKTFNLAGLQLSNIFIANRELRHAFRRELHAAGYSQPNVLGLVACRAAYAQGAAWLDALRTYLQGNLSYLRDFLASELPEIRLVEPEGTYLVWLDCSALGMKGSHLDDFMLNQAGLWLDDGTMFGEGGEGFQRINIACPRATLTDALSRLQQAVQALRLQA